MADAVRGGVNSGKFLNGSGAGQHWAVMAAKRREAEESRVPPLTDFTADASPLPLFAENRVVPTDQLHSAVEAVAPIVNDGEGHLGKKP